MKIMVKNYYDKFAYSQLSQFNDCEVHVINSISIIAQVLIEMCVL